MKERTSISISAHARRVAKEAAKRRGISLSELVEGLIAEHVEPPKKRKFTAESTFRDGRNLARDHDKWAWGE